MEAQSRFPNLLAATCMAWAWLTVCRMRNAHILLINMRALANEVAKNLVLAGIGSLTVLDADTVVEDDLGAQFFVSERHVGLNVCHLPPPRPGYSYLRCVCVRVCI